ncbi:hypothetical protein Tco_1570649 [Tanacetum coccineum]
MQSPFLQSIQKGSFQPEGEHIKKDKGKKVISSEEAKKESTNSDSDNDDSHLTGSMVEPSRIKKVKKFDFVTEGGKHIHLTEEEINHQKKIEEDAKAKAAKRKSEVRKEELVDLLGPEVVNKRAESRITNCDVLTKKGPITLKVYREDGTSEVIPNFKASDMHLAELGINLDIPLSEQDPLNKLNDLSNKKRKHVDDIHDYFKANKRLKDFVTIEDLKIFSNTMLYTVQEIFFRRHQGPGLDDHARTFSAFLLAEIDKRNLNPLKQMRTIEQLRQ